MTDNYTHIEAHVEAYCHTLESQTIILELLADEASALLMSKFQATHNPETSLYHIVFRYKTDTVDSVLNPGDYIVRLNTGTFVTLTEEQFKARYIHTSLDPVIQDPKNVYDVVLAAIKAADPATTILTPEALTDEVLLAFGEAYARWYNPTTDIMQIKLNDENITNPLGLAHVANGMCKASYVKETTKFELHFTNGGPITKPNCFNFIALQNLIGELKQIEEPFRKAITSISFASVQPGVASAVAPSVETAQWDYFVSHVRLQTGITDSHNIRR